MNALYFSLFFAIFGFACSYFGFTSPILGFYLMLLALPLAIGSMIPLLRLLFKRKKLFKRSWLRIIAGFASLGVLGYIVYLAYLNPLNDISTDPINPPNFVHPVYRIKVKGGGENLGEEFLLDRKFMGNPKVQSEKYKEITPIIVKVPFHLLSPLISSALTKFPQWKITYEDKVRNHTELEASSEILKFVDDIVIEGRAIDAFSSQVVIRSRSRVGKSDLGANAKRVIAFSNALRSLAVNYENQIKPKSIPTQAAQPVTVNPSAKTSGIKASSPQAKGKP